MKVEAGSCAGLAALEKEFGDRVTAAAKSQKKWSKAKKTRFRDFGRKLSEQTFEVVRANVTIRGDSWDVAARDKDYAPKDPELKKQLIATQEEVQSVISRVVGRRRSAVSVIRDALTAAASERITALTSSPKKKQSDESVNKKVKTEHVSQFESALKGLQALGKRSQTLLGKYKMLQESATTQLSIATSQMETLISQHATVTSSSLEAGISKEAPAAVSPVTVPVSTVTPTRSTSSSKSTSASRSSSAAKAPVTSIPTEQPSTERQSITSPTVELSATEPSEEDITAFAASKKITRTPVAEKRRAEAPTPVNASEDLNTTFTIEADTDSPSESKMKKPRRSTRTPAKVQEATPAAMSTPDFASRSMKTKRTPLARGTPRSSKRTRKAVDRF